MKKFKTVLPEKYNERNIVSSVIGAINDYVPLSHNRSNNDEQVFWSKFETCDLNSCSFLNKLTFPLILSIGTCKAFYIWGLESDGKASLLFSDRNSCTIGCTILPSPVFPSTENKDDFFDKRPLIALCDSPNRACCHWQVRFLSLLENEPARTLYFETRCLSVDATDRFVLVSRTDSITVLSAYTLLECFTVSRVRPNLLSNGFPKAVPLALGTRWLAFADVKPVYHHLSRCGDASQVESEPLTSAVLNMNKRIWSSLTALASTVVSTSVTPGAFQPSSARAVAQGPQLDAATGGLADTNYDVSGPPNHSNDTASSPGYVTIVDLVTMSKQYETWQKLESSTATISLSTTTVTPDSASVISHSPLSSPHFGPDCRLTGTSYINVHEHCEAGAVVAHFMAHRWANVALLRFDPSGSLLFSACTRGHAFNVFRISSHPSDQRQTAIHHLYILERGTIPCEVLDAAFSHDSRWVAVSTNHGTTHVFPITSYGGPITVRTHGRPHVVNRTSRYHRSSGLEEHHLTRPQRERSSVDVAGNTGTVSGSMSSEHVGSSQAPLILPGSTSAALCRGAPMAGLSPQCPHLGFTAASSLSFSQSHLISDSKDTVASNASTNLTLIPSNPSYVPSVVEGACACPLNALYNSTNPRLPPYPEPCQIKPEARLRPHNPGNTTTGAAVAAFGVASEAFESVTAGSSGSTILPRNSVPSYPISHGHHYGPCVHNPRPGRCSRVSRLSNQPLPVVDQYGETVSWPPTGPTTSVRFAPPICFLPSRPRHGGTSLTHGRNPYVTSKSRAIDGLFILAPDLHLIEYDLCVFPRETASCGEKLYQDGEIRLEGVPVGEWNLRTHATCSPPFSKSHPLVAAVFDLRKMVDSNCCLLRTPPDEALTHVFEVAGHTSIHDESFDNSATHSFSSQPVDSFCKSSEESEPVTAAPAGWSPEDAASYWYSQVEITTHLGPLRRVWMGPQFTFRAYSKSTDTRNSSVTVLPNADEESSSSLIQAVNVQTLLSSDAQKIMPPCEEVWTLQPIYHLNSVDTDIADFLSLGGLNMSSRSSFTGTNMLYPEPNVSGAASPAKPLPKSGISRLPSGRPIESTCPAIVSRWRHRSGEPSRPISISGALSGHATDMPIFIEGGSYQDSSLGGSLSSLVGRGGDDVASCIAEAIQDNDTCWLTEKPSSEPGPITAPGGLNVIHPNLLSLNLKTPSIALVPSVSHYATTMTIDSPLCEADFPSQEASPKHISGIAIGLDTDPELIEGDRDIPSLPLTTKPEVVQSSVMQSSPAADEVSMTVLRTTKPVTKKSKRSKRDKQKSRKQCSGSTGELADKGGILSTDAWKGQRTSMTSPSVSARDSLSSSPAVIDDISLEYKDPSKSAIASGSSEECGSRTKWEPRSCLTHADTKSDDLGASTDDYIYDAVASHHLSVIGTINPEASDVGSD